MRTIGSPVDPQTSPHAQAHAALLDELTPSLDAPVDPRDLA